MFFVEDLSILCRSKCFINERGSFVTVSREILTIPYLSYI